MLLLLVALTGAAVLTLATAWRRADTVVARWTRTAISYDSFVVAQLGPDEMRALPGVERADRVTFTPLFARGSQPVDGQAMDLSALTSTTILLDGRIPSGDDPLEVLVDELAAAELGLRVGDTVDVQFFAPDQVGDIFGGNYLDPHGLIGTATVTGIVRPWQNITADRWVTPPDGSQAPHPIFIFPISLLDDHADEVVRFGVAWPYDVQFTPGTDPAAFAAAAQAAIGPGVDDFLPTFQMSPPLFPPKLAQISAAVWTQTRVLLVLALIVAVASALALVAATRATERQFRRDLMALDALGMTRRSAVATALWRTSPTIAGGVLLAVPLSWLVSDRLPIGLAALVEPHPGRTVDFVTAAVVLCLWAAVSAVCAATATLVRRTDAARPRRHRVVPSMGARRLDLALACGRTERGGGQRAALWSGVAAIAAVVAVGAVVAGLDDVSTHRAERGMWGDVFVGNSNFPLTDTTRAAVEGLDGVKSVSAMAFAPDFDLDGHTITVMTLEPSSTAEMRHVLRGRMPEGPREVLLGAQLARDLHKDVGDIITLAGQNTPADFTVVGIGPAPLVGDTTLGQTAVISSTAITDDWGGPPPSMLAVELDDPSRIEAVKAQLATSTTDVVEDIVPRAVVNAVDLRGLLLWSALVVAFVAALLAINASVAGDRRWRRDAGVLRAFGATPRDLLGIALWLGLLRGLAVGVVGAAIGAAIGIRAWSTTADALGLPAPARVPWLSAIAVLVPIILFLALAALTAVRARPRRLTTALHTE